MLNRGKDLEHFEVPHTFLNLPLVGNISQEPSQSYNMPTKGRIHGSKLSEIFKFLEGDDLENWRSAISDILDGLSIADEVKSLSFSQFLDLLIHLAYANPDINWNSVSILEKFLKNKFDHTPRWHLPKLDFQDELNSFYSTRLSSIFEEEQISKILTIRDLVEDSFPTKKVEYILPQRLIKTIQTSSYFNFHNYLQLLGNISVLQQTGLIRYEKFQELIVSLSTSCQKLYYTEYFKTPIKKILFAVHFITVFVSDTPHAIETSQSLLSKANLELNNLDPEQRKSYQWLLDGAKAMLVNEITKYKMEMVTEDLLIRSLGDRFLHPENSDLETWMHAIETTNVSIDIVIILIRGYLSVENILQRYNSQLPNNNNTTLININNFIMSLLKAYDTKHQSIESSEVRQYFYLEYYFTNAWATTALNQVKITPRDHYISEQIVEVRIRNSIFSDYFEMHLICIDILNGVYPIDEYISTIKEVDEAYPNLIGNEQFAKMFVNTFARGFNYGQQTQINGIGAPLDMYENLIFFLQIWLSHLLTIEDLIQDAIILFLSFFKVATNMVEGYYSQKGRLKTAKLWHLNYTLFELNLFSLYRYPKLQNINKIVSRENIFKDFTRLLRHFDLDENLNTGDYKYIAIDTIYDTSSLKLNLSESYETPGKLKEDNIMEYLSLRDKLDGFLKNLEISSAKQISEIFENPIFQTREQPLTIFDHLPSQIVIEGLTYPFIRPINAYAAAIRFFDLDIELPDFKIDTVE